MGFVAGIGIGIWKGWQLAVIILLIAPFHGGLVSKIAKISGQTDTAAVDLTTDSAEVVLEAVTAIRTVKQFGGQRREYSYVYRPTFGFDRPCLALCALCVCSQTDLLPVRLRIFRPCHALPVILTNTFCVAGPNCNGQAVRRYRRAARAGDAPQGQL